MSLQYAYNFAEIDPETNMCIQVISTTDPTNAEIPNFVAIPVNDENYLLKYYNRDNGQWYEDAEFTIPWQSSLI